MWLLVVFSALATTWLDLFFLSPFSEGYALYTGTVVLVLFLAHRGSRAAFAFAILSGALGDIVSPGSPFGTYLLLNAALFAVGHALMRQFFSARSDLSVALLAATTSAVGIVFMALATYCINVWRLAKPFPFWGSFRPFALVYTPLLAALFAGVCLLVIRIVRTATTRWFFVRR